jgi:hypothetical protein
VQVPLRPHPHWFRVAGSRLAATAAAAQQMAQSQVGGPPTDAQLRYRRKAALAASCGRGPPAQGCMFSVQVQIHMMVDLDCETCVFFCVCAGTSVSITWAVLGCRCWKGSGGETGGRASGWLTAGIGVGGICSGGTGLGLCWRAAGE